MAFGSSNNQTNSNSISNRVTTTSAQQQHTHHHHHHHHSNNLQSSVSSVSNLQQQQSLLPTQQCNSSSAGASGAAAPPPNLPPKSYYHAQQQQQQFLHHHNNHHHQQQFFQTNSNSSLMKGAFPQQQQQHHHHRHQQSHHNNLHGNSGYGGDGDRSSNSALNYNSNSNFVGGSGGGGGSVQVSQQSSSSQLAFNNHSNHGGGGGGGGVFGGGSGGGSNSNNQHLSRDLTEPERLMLDQIRARKASLLKEIAQLQDEIDCVSKELICNSSTSSSTLPSQQQHHPPPPDLIQQQQQLQIPLADVEVDNLSEHDEDDHHHANLLNKQRNKGALPLGSNTSSNSGGSGSAASAASKEKDRLKLMSLGCKKFNMDPKKGIEFLVENGLLKDQDEMDVGMFLYRGEGLNKTAIGDYLGERSDFNERVLKVFVGLHDFTDLILVQALRQFLWSFRLPGEAQKIDRMMECFAARYCANNPDIFTNTDTCYVLSFAIIMLNTSLHNPSVKDKPTVDQFISMNRGINNGGDLPRELLVSLYNSIQSEPFKINGKEDDDLMTTFFNPDKEGWLWKQGGRYKTWKRRWFILNDNCLYYFEFTTDKEPRGIIPLENVGVKEIDDGSKDEKGGGGAFGSSKKQRFCFELFATDGSEVIKACKTDSDGRVVEGQHKIYRMSAGSGEERDCWVKALRQSISYSPLYEILKKSGGGNTTTSTSTGSLGRRNNNNNKRFNM